MAEIKKFDDLTIQDDFIFQKVMLNPDICKKTLEKILGIRIAKIDYKPQNEKVAKATVSSKGIRMDVFTMDDEGAVFDIEMQVAQYEETYLPKRMRYYQAAIDIELLNTGQDYPDLNRSYIIFICPFDEFGGGRHIYTFKNVCLEDNKVILADDAVKIVLSTKGTADDVPPDVLAFLQYVDGLEVSGNEFVDEIKGAVDTVKQTSKWRDEYMLINAVLMDARRTARREGRQEGKSEAEREMVKNLKLAGADVAFIAKISGWSEEKIAAVK